MQTEVATAPDTVLSAIDEVRGHAHAASLAGLALDVLSRQAEGRTLFAGRDYVRARAEIHGVETDDARSDAGNVLSILERGAETPLERALVAAFAVAGLDAKLASAEEARWPALLGRFVRHVDWLTLASPYEIYPVVDALLARAHSEALWAAVADVVLAEDRNAADARARNAVRLTALARSGSESADAQLRRLARDINDAATRAMARSLAGIDDAPAPAAATFVIKGVAGRASRSWLITVLRIVSGFAVLQWVGRMLARVVGFRREVDIELAPGSMHVHRRTWLASRLVRDRREVHTVAALGSVTRAARYPAVHLLVGIFALSVGVLVGGLFAADGVRGGDAWLLFVGALMIFVGAGLDLALSVLIPARASRVAIEVCVLPQHRIGVARVPLVDADRFVDAVDAQLEARAKVTSVIAR